MRLVINKKKNFILKVLKNYKIKKATLASKMQSLTSKKYKTAVTQESGVSF